MVDVADKEREKYLNDIKNTKKSQEKVLTSIKDFTSKAAARWWRWWWWSLQMPCKFTLWPAELFLQLLTNKTQQKLGHRECSAAAAKGGKLHKATKAAKAAKGGKRHPRPTKQTSKRNLGFGWRRGKYVSAPA